ncbi:putative O-methyltransferase, family 3, S-adenosyl-L-methionine-dependent methyltransferase [Rosa chinensis]|uniref:Putative O-methyltransferase, family 3, S-adenosyl-L-methionine-dependent methyltransferase n=1 Tax=Rosa chinensis TaxID=74649 RepID=A0A2P6RK17_ROSCH|nr:putative O-methyltransferase, family 3, S-adenosyl-L-methionine-dependent methyltransferase [Rosa chinensis]
MQKTIEVGVFTGYSLLLTVRKIPSHIFYNTMLDEFSHSYCMLSQFLMMARFVSLYIYIS